MFWPWNRRTKRRPARTPLNLEVLEDRALPSAAAPTTVLDLNGLSVNPGQYSSTDVLVRFQTPPGSAGGPALVPGTTLAGQLPLVSGLYQVDLSKGMSVAQALTAYRAEPGVLDAEPDYQLQVSWVPNDPLLSQQWSLHNTGQNGGTPGADIHAEQAWSVTSGSPGVVVAILDTGIDYDSPDLYDNIWINQAEIPDAWYTKSSPSSGYNRLVYKWQIHTATPGIITFRDLNNPINRGLVWDNNGDGRIDAGDLLRPTTQGGWMTPNNTRDGDTAHPNDLFGWNFVNNSNNPFDDNGHGTNVSGILGATGNNGVGVAGVDWNVQLMPLKFLGGNGQGSVSAFIQGLNYAVQHGAKLSNNSWEGAPYSQALYNAINNARAHGQIFVAAAGNEGTNDDAAPDYPASFSQSLNNVVTVAATDNSDHLASFSNWGPHSVELAAPGVNILSTLPNGQYGAMSGTSMATPEVTGALALVWGLHPSWSYTQVIDQVLNTVDRLPSLQGKVSTGGRLDLAAAVGWNLSTRTAPLVTSIRAEGPTSNSMNSLWLTFNEPIDVSSFTSSSVRLTNPSGQVIPVTVRVVNNSGDRQIALIFSNQTMAGDYHLSINSSVRDLMGSALAPYQATIAVRGTQTAPRGPQTFTNRTATAIKPWTTVSSAITVPSGERIGGVKVQLDISYPDDGELYVYLIAPNGKTIAMTDNRGGKGANFQNTVFTDQAGSSIASGHAPFAGSYRPDSSLSQLNGLNAGGTWRLVIKDNGGHRGTLQNWSLVLTPAGTAAASVIASSSLPSTSPPPAAPAASPVSSSSVSANETTPASLPSINNGSTSSILTALTSEANSGSPSPPAPPRGSFVSGGATPPTQMALQVGKRPPNNATNRSTGDSNG